MYKHTLSRAHTHAYSGVLALLPGRSHGLEVRELPDLRQGEGRRRGPNWQW
jgi:hypothetical protein